MNPSPQEAIALWRYQVIAPLLSLEKTRGALRAAIHRLSQRLHSHPTRGSIRVGYGTIEAWYYDYLQAGLEGLLPQARHDRGRSRRIDATLAEAIETLAKARPQLDGPGLWAELKAQQPPLPYVPSLSTLYRFLRAHHLDQRRAPRREDHRAYAFELAGDCWQADVMYGPTLAQRDGRRRKTYLIAILDDATRLIAHAQFYFEQHLVSLKDCLKQALLKRGVPRRLYFDNGKIFRSRLLLRLAARLGIQLLHTRPFRPQGRAKLERWFGGVRRTFLSRLDLDHVEDLEALNRLLWAWIEGEYHLSAHRGLEGEKPLDRWIRLSTGLRPLPPEVDLDALFLEETTRRVGKDGTLTLEGKRFEAGVDFIGTKVTLRFDPFDLRRLYLLDATGRTVVVFPLDREGNRHVRRERLEAPSKTLEPPPPLKALESLADTLERSSPSTPSKEASHEH